MELVLWVVIGFISGTVTGAAVPGRSPGGWLGAVVLGMLAGMLGGWVAHLLGLGTSTTWIGALGSALAICAVVMFVVRPNRSNSSA